MTERERRALYAALASHEASPAVLLDLLARCQSEPDPLVRCGCWDLFGYLVQSAKEPIAEASDGVQG